MSEPRPDSLSTRWTMLDQLQGPQAEDAWRWFVDRYRPFVRGCLRQMLRDASAAEDEVWSYLFTSQVFERADRARRFRSYLSGVLRNFAREFHRRNRAPQSDDDDRELEPAAPLELPEDQEMRLWSRQILQLSLGKLAGSHRDDAVALRMFYGLQEVEGTTQFLEPQPVSAIAEELGTNANAVHQTLFRGRKRLRAHIEAELRETVREQSDLDDEIALILEVIQREAPGLTDE